MQCWRTTWFTSVCLPWTSVLPPIEQHCVLLRKGWFGGVRGGGENCPFCPFIPPQHPDPLCHDWLADWLSSPRAWWWWWQRLYGSAHAIPNVLFDWLHWAARCVTPWEPCILFNEKYMSQGTMGPCIWIRSGLKHAALWKGHERNLGVSSTKPYYWLLCQTVAAAAEGQSGGGSCISLGILQLTSGFLKVSAQARRMYTCLACKMCLYSRLNP